MSDSFVGIDIGTSKVSAVVGEFSEEGDLQITGLGVSPSQGLRRGVVVNIESTLKSVYAAVTQAEQMSGREVDSCVVGIAGAHIEGINSRGVVAVTGKGHEINQQDVNRVIEAARAVSIPMDREILHVIPQEFIVDGQNGVRNPIDMIGVRLQAEVHIITGSVTSAQNLVKCVNRAGYKVDQIVLEALAGSRAVLSADEMELGALVIDFGGGTTDIMVHMGGAPYFSSVIPLGGMQVTADLSIVLKTPFETAEEIKRNHGRAHPSVVEETEPVIVPGVGGRGPRTVSQQEICDIVHPRVAEVFGIVQEKLDKKGFQVKDLAGGVVITGGGALLPGIVETAQDVFGTAARIGFPGNLGGIGQDYQSSEFSTAVGLLLFAAASARVDTRTRPS